MYSQNDDPIAYLAAVALGMALLAWAFITVIVIWLIVSAFIAAQRLERLTSEAEESFERVKDRAGLDIPVEPVLERVFGLSFAEGNEGDWLGSAIFGTTV
jgi:hypothetical protein